MGETEEKVKQVAGEKGALFIAPYNDPLIIGGQGTIGIELMRQVGHMDAVFVPVG
ncbi:MAG: pyridoxal-phosphate dependent enzyme, partial [bacterium]|nr:pyridoxal-phosphate dependent enzyme [bacterium]